jgi:hypothetical protein
MIEFPQSRLVRPGSRLYDRVNNLVITNAAICIASHYLAIGDAKFNPGDVAAYDCRQCDLSVKLPVYGPLQVALDNLKPDLIQISLLKREPEPQMYNPWAAGFGNLRASYRPGVLTAVANSITPLFVEFYETYRGFIHGAYRKPERYPPLWRFARVVRNSVAHGGCITILDSKESPATWRSLSYSYADNGRSIIGGHEADLSPGDLILLMFEMNDLLDEEGSPL